MVRLPSRPATVALSSRLVLSFGLTCAALIAIGGFIFFSLHSLELLDRKTSSSAFDEIRVLRDARREADAMNNEAMRALTALTPGERQEQAVFVTRLQNKNHEELSIYESGKVGGDERGLVQEIQHSRREFFSEVEGLITRTKPLDDASVSATVIAKEVSVYQAYQKALLGLLHFEENENREMVASSTHRLEQTKWVGIVLLSVAILIGAWTGFTLHRLIGKLRKDKRRLQEEVEERARGAAALRESEARYRLLFAHSPDAILVVCEDLIVFVNPAALSLLGAEREELLIGRSPAEIVHPDEREAVVRRTRDALAGDPPPTAERRMVRLDGTSIEVESRIIPFTYEGKAAIQVIIRDNTERKSAAEKLNAQEKQYRLLFEDNPSPMWVYETRTLKFLAVNGAAIAHYGYSREEFLARTLTSIRPATDVARFLTVISDPGTPKEYSGIWKHRTKAGRIITVAIHSSPIDFEGRKARLATAFDITERIASERRIREREASLALAQHVAGVGSWEYRFGADGRIDHDQLFWSAEVYHLFGFSRQDSRPSTTAFFQAVHPGDRVKVAQHFRTFQQEGGRLSVDHRIVRPDGVERFVHLAAEVITAGSEGTPSKVIGTIMDITEQVTKAKALAKAEEKYRAIFAHASEGIFQSSLEGKFLVVNPAAARIFGFDSPEEMKEGRSDISRQSYVDPARRAEFVRQIEEAGVVNDFECEVYRKDGSKVWISENARIVRDEAGRTLYFEGTIQDISERKYAAERLREQANLLNLAHDAIMVCDMEDRIVFWNNGAERLYGWTEKEVRGRAISEFLHYIDPEAMQLAQEIFLQTGEWSGEKKDRTKNGETLVVHSRWSLVRDEEGRPKSKLVINTDITEQKKIEEQFLRAQRLESIGTLASGVAHDLNNILLPIMMAAPILREEMEAGDRDRFLDIVEANARRGADIIKQVLTFARGADGVRILLQPIYLLEEVTKIALQTFPKSITIRTSYEENVHALEADPTQLHQVLLNLSINARDAMPNGGQLQLRAENFEVDEHFARMTPGASPGPHVMLQVTDSGTGIPKEVVEKIFDPFFTTKSIGLGTGLGLSTVAGIVKGHGGFLKLYTQPGHTSFSVFLPAKTAAEHGNLIEAETLVPRGNGEIILVVDDEPNIREVAELILASHGYTVHVAEDGPTALAIFAQQIGKIAAVVTDLAMPVMGGLMLVRTLRRLQPGLKIIVSTGRGEETQSDEIAALGVDGCLTKPYTTRNFLFKLHKVLRSLQDAA
jgi:PAS domain S-box-containing protein